MATPLSEPTYRPARVVVPGALEEIPRWATLLGLIAAQALVAIASSSVAEAALAHAAAVVGVAFFAMVTRNVTLSICVMAFLPGSEVLWRQSDAPIPYQLGPYLSIALAGFCLFFITRHTTRTGMLALMYASLVIPGAVLTISAAGAGARPLLAFSLAGPLALATAVALCSGLTVSEWLFRRLLWTTLISCIGPLAFALTRFKEWVGNYGAVEFSTQSAYATSGEFGPVQVSTVLGLGCLTAILLLIAEPDLAPRVVAALAGIVFAVQSLLTFSRGGMLSVGIAVAALIIARSGDRADRRRIWAIVAAAFLLGYFVVVPRLDAYTKGAFNERFSSAETGRTDLAGRDLGIFFDNPIFGVGPGMIKYQELDYSTCLLRTDRCLQEASSHTEYTRLLAEHGVVGIIAMGTTFAMAFQILRRPPRDRVFAITLAAWALAQMAYANLRVIAIPVMFGLAFLRIGRPDEGPPPEVEPEPSTREPVPIDLSAFEGF